MYRILLTFSLLVFMVSCAKPTTVTIIDQSVGSNRGIYHIVQRGESLYIIAWANGLDYRDLVKWNKLKNPDLITVGQKIMMSSTASRVSTRSFSTSAKSKSSGSANSTNGKASSSIKKRENTGSKKIKRWQWPAAGKIVDYYSVAKGKKGIDISGSLGSPVRAASSGMVVYAGTGLRGYGKLVILKHSSDYLSAYAHNSSIIVHEGDSVSSGQKIALMGQSESKEVKLHFEIRYDGKPINPLSVLPKRK
ncbi:MAG: peptidoglycan DD-metalloendopeptidase family protein [Arenicellales bacterium]|nr:peptidoglycan DD-metalloendopeptidase family protein [Arenicellales bacterium]